VARQQEFKLNAIKNTLQTCITSFKPDTFLVFNNTPNICYFRRGAQDIPTAQDADYIIPPGDSLVIPTDSVEFAAVVDTTGLGNSQVIIIFKSEGNGRDRRNFHEVRVNKLNTRQSVSVQFNPDALWILNLTAGTLYVATGSNWIPEPVEADLIVNPNNYYNYSPEDGTFQYGVNLILPEDEQGYDCILIFSIGYGELLTPQTITPYPYPAVPTTPLASVVASFTWV